MSTINNFLEAVKLILFILIILIIFEDSNRNFRSFLKYVERKFLVIHSVKLLVLTIVVYKFELLSPYDTIIASYSFIFLIIFLTLLSLRQVEIGKEKFEELRAFKYNKFSEIFLRIFTSLVNLREILIKRVPMKEKYKSIMFMAMFPIQKYIAVSITGIEFTNRKEKFITDSQLVDIKSQLEPGDILLKRNDWQATNLGIPGFWTHAGLYIGNIQKLDEYFSDVITLNGRKFSSSLENINKNIYNEMVNHSDLDIIEAIEEGVSVKPLSNIAKSDYFCALRPTLSKEKKLEAIRKSFSFVGCPYDYHFDINTDNAFVCSEVIQKSYGNDIYIPSDKKLGKIIILPNNIAKKYSKERKRRNKQLEFVLFYDLDVAGKTAYKSTEKEFSKTYNRGISYYRKQDLVKYISTIVNM